jgi:hypothetical protein
MENKNRILFAGVLIGAATGLIAAMLLTRRAEQTERESAITPGTAAGHRLAGG